MECVRAHAAAPAGATGRHPGRAAAERVAGHGIHGIQAATDYAEYTEKDVATEYTEDTERGTHGTTDDQNVRRPRPGVVRNRLAGDAAEGALRDAVCGVQASGAAA